jgi:hypothetical protein
MHTKCKPRSSRLTFTYPEAAIATQSYYTTCWESGRVTRCVNGWVETPPSRPQVKDLGTTVSLEGDPGGTGRQMELREGGRKASKDKRIHGVSW